MVITIHEDSRFSVELANAGSKLVLVEFMANWCGPCHRIAPIFEEMSQRYSDVVFLKVDVDKCTETAGSQGIKAMPTFNFYRNKVKIAHLQGADAQAIEGKLKELTATLGDEVLDPGIKGHIDLVSFINKSHCECLNDSDDHPFTNCLTSDKNYTESDCDEQLIMSLGFNQTVKLHSLKIIAPEENGPKTIKIFINQPHTLDFEQADSMEAIQTLQIDAGDISSGKPIPLKYVKYQNVQNLQVFIKENQGGTDVTRIEQFVIIGSPIVMTNMSDFKRVQGKKGESH